MSRRAIIETRVLLLLLLLLTGAVVALFAYGRSSSEDFWLAGVCVAYGAVLGRLFWSDLHDRREEKPLVIEQWRPEPLPPNSGDPMIDPGESATVVDWPDTNLNPQRD